MKQSLTEKEQTFSPLLESKIDPKHTLHGAQRNGNIGLLISWNEGKASMRFDFSNNPGLEKHAQNIMDNPQEYRIQETLSGGVIIVRV